MSEVMSVAERKAYSVPEVADILGVSVDTVYEMVRSNDLPHKRLGRRIIVPVQSLNAWLENADEWEFSGGKT